MKFLITLVFDIRKRIRSKQSYSVLTTSPYNLSFHNELIIRTIQCNCFNLIRLITLDKSLYYKYCEEREELISRNHLAAPHGSYIISAI